MKKIKKLKITKHIGIAELAEAYPKLAEVLMEDYGLHCIGCFASGFDTLESGAELHGMSKEEIDEMVKRLNEILNSSKRKDQRSKPRSKVKAERIF